MAEPWGGRLLRDLLCSVAGRSLNVAANAWMQTRGWAAFYSNSDHPTDHSPLHAARPHTGGGTATGVNLAAGRYAIAIAARNGRFFENMEIPASVPADQNLYGEASWSSGLLDCHPVPKCKTSNTSDSQATSLRNIAFLHKRQGTAERGSRQLTCSPSAGLVRESPAIALEHRRHSTDAMPCRSMSQRNVISVSTCRVRMDRRDSQRRRDWHRRWSPQVLPFRHSDRGSISAVEAA